VHGLGWSAISISTSVLRVFCTLGALVCTFMPFSAGRTHAAASTRPPTSTTHTRQTPTGVSFCAWHSVGIGIPFIRAASNIVVPGSTATCTPSMVSCTWPVLIKLSPHASDKRLRGIAS
jgi:hypothetical protein